MGLERLDTTGVTGPLDTSARIAAQRRAEMVQKKAAMLTTMVAIGGAALGSAVPGVGTALGASIGGAAGGALAGRPPNVPALVQTGIAMQDRNTAQQAAQTEQAAISRATEQFRGTPEMGEMTGGEAPDPRGAMSTLLPTRLGGAALSGLIRGEGQGGGANTIVVGSDASGRYLANKQTGEKIRDLTKPISTAGTKPIRDTAFVNVAPEGQTPSWETRAITNDDQVSALVREHGQDRVTLEDPRRGQAAAFEQQTKERRRGKQQAGAQQGVGVATPTTTREKPASTRTMEAIEGGGIGPASNIKALIDNVAGGLQTLTGETAKSLFPDTQQNRQHLKGIRQFVQGVFQKSDRFPKWEKDQINQILMDPDKFWKNPATAARDMVTLRQLIHGKISLNNEAIMSESLTDPQVDKLVLKNLELKGIASWLGGTPSQPQAQSPQQSAPNNDLTALFATDTTGWNAVQLRKHKNKIKELMQKDRTRNPELF